MEENDELDAASGRAPMLVSLAVVIIVGAVVMLLGDESASRSDAPGAGLTSFVAEDPVPGRAADPPIPLRRPPGTRPPVARIAEPVYRPICRAGGLPVRVSLDAGRSSDPDRDPLRYRWDLDGDGDVDEEVVRPDPTVTLRHAGRLRVSLFVFDGTGFRDRASVVLRPGRFAAAAGPQRKRDAARAARAP